MHLILSYLIGYLILQAAPTAGQKVLTVPDVGRVTYDVSVPPGYDPKTPVPLVLTLHPSGPRVPYYGSAFMRQIVVPSIADLHAVVVAPDCPAASWTDPLADRAVMAVIDKIRQDFSIDRRRVAVIGFSMGGRGVWFMAAQHPDVFTAAVPMAAAVGDQAIDRLALMPTYVIHSRNDEVVPFAPAERNAQRLEMLGRTIRFEALDGIGHFEMGEYRDALRRAGKWIGERWPS